MTIVTIVTIVKDNASGLLATFSSLEAQNHPDWEMIIVAAPSNDSTLESAEELVKRNPAIRIIKQNGLGIFSAMNDGIENALGEFIWFMNAGDKFAGPLVLGSALHGITNANVGILIGGYQIKGEVHTKQYSFRSKDLSAINFAFSRRGGCHQAMIFRTVHLKKLGGFNLDYKFNADFALVLEIIRLAGARRVSEVFADIEPGGFADQNIHSVHREKHTSRKNHFQSISVNFLSSTWTLAAKSKIQLRKVLRNKSN